MNLGLQRRIFEAEDRYRLILRSREELLEKFKKFFLIAIALLLVACVLPIFLLHSSEKSVNQLVGLATGILVLLALFAFLLMFTLWQRRFSRQLQESELELIEAQRAFVATKIYSPTTRNLVELGFPRGSSPTESALGVTSAHNLQGMSCLFTLSYNAERGYFLDEQLSAPSMEAQKMRSVTHDSSAQ